MPGIRTTHIICYDDHRNFTEEVRKRFSDRKRYTVDSFHNKADFMEYVRKEKDRRSCRVALIGVPDTREQFEMIAGMTADIKKADPFAGIILLGHDDKMEDLRKAVRFNIDSYIPRNSNAILRIHNTVKRLVSERNIAIFRKRRNISLYALLGFIIMMIILIVIARFRLPHYF